MRRRLFLGAMLAALAVVVLTAAWVAFDPTVGTGTALAITRAVRLVATGAATGLLVLLVVVWRPLRRAGTIDEPADQAFTRAGGRALRGFAVLGAVGAGAAVVLAAGGGPGGALIASLSPGDLVDTLGTRSGAWTGVTALAFTAVAVLAPAAVRRGDADRLPRELVATALLVAVLVVAPALGGSAVISSPAVVLVPVEIVHVAAMGAWIGGLLVLLLVLPGAVRALPEGPPRTRLLAAVLLRFSPVALVAVVVLTLAGTVLSLLLLTTLYDLADTAYGRALFVKIVLLLIAITLAVLQREYLVPQLERAVAAGDPDAAPEPAARGLADGPPPDPAVAARHVRAALRAEALLLVAVLVVTGALAGYPTPKRLADRPATATRTAAGLELRVVVAPARVGDNAVRLTVRRPDGRPAADARVVRIRALPPGRRGSSDTPVTVGVTSAGAGRWVASAVPLGARGTWRLAVELVAPAREPTTVELPVRVR